MQHTIEFPEVHDDVVDGVRAFWAPMDGPFTAVLQFDGGMCVEAPHERGTQHLIEHLILTQVGPQPYDYNGYVDLRRTAFAVRGQHEEVRQFFDVVSAGLAALPIDAITHESGVLVAEAARSSGSSLTSLLAYTFGTAGPGASALPELGLGVLDGDDLMAWMRQRMTRSRAALFCSGDPSFLDLSGVPAGDRGPLWTLPDAIDGPGWTSGNASGFAAVAHVPRSTAVATMIRTLRDHCLDHVRHREGLSYSVEVLYDPLTAGDVLLGLFIDAAPERRVEARNAVFEALDVFAERGPDPRWLDLDADRRARSMREPSAGVARASNAAADHCLGRSDPLDDSWLDEYQRLTPRDLAEAAQAFLSAASWQMPAEAPMPPWRDIPRLAWFSPSRVSGRDLVSKSTVEYGMTAGPAGISLVLGADRIATICFDDVVATEAWEDGTRTIYGRDSTRFYYSPSDWAEGPDFHQWLDAQLSRAPMLRRPGRPPT